MEKCKKRPVIGVPQKAKENESKKRFLSLTFCNSSITNAPPLTEIEHLAVQVHENNVARHD
jgi:hypothetical protein